MKQENPFAATSFISEHSAEYVLVPNLASILSVKYPSLVPIYFWATREGGSLAVASLGSSRVRLVTAFARRPKTNNPGSDVLFLKINASLLEAAETGARLGSPVFAGVPLATSLLHFNTCTPCAWFALPGEVQVAGDIHIRLSLSEKRSNPSNKKGVINGPLTEDEIMDIVSRKTIPMTWADAVQAMKNIRKSGRSYGWFMAGYQPFFLIIPV